MRKDDFDVYKLYMTCLKDSAMTLVLWFSSSLQVVKVTVFFFFLATRTFDRVGKKAC